MARPYLELVDRLGYKLLKDHGPLHPESWPALAAQYAEPFVRHAFDGGRYDFIWDCFQNSLLPAAQGASHDLTQDNFFRCLECLTRDVLDAANSHLRDLLDVQDFRLLDQDNSETHQGTWTGKSYLTHACFLNRNDIDCEWNDHDNARKDEELAFYSATEAYQTLRQYLIPFQAIDVPRNVIVVGISEENELIFLNEEGIKQRLATKPEWNWHRPKKRARIDLALTPYYQRR